MSLSDLDFNGILNPWKRGINLISDQHRFCFKLIFYWFKVLLATLSAKVLLYRQSNIVSIRDLYALRPFFNEMHWVIYLRSFKRALVIKLHATFTLLENLIKQVELRVRSFLLIEFLFFFSQIAHYALRHLTLCSVNSFFVVILFNTKALFRLRFLRTEIRTSILLEKWALIMNKQWVWLRNILCHSIAS